MERCEGKPTVSNPTAKRSAAAARFAPPAEVARSIRWWSQRHPECSQLEARLTQYVGLILRANQRMNLTADGRPERFWRRHVEDALLSARCIETILSPDAAGSRILEVGSGGGVPGLIWALLWPAANFELLDSRRKRVAFLNQAIECLALTNARTLTGRAEQLGRDPAHREQFDLVTARALAPLPVLLELTLPFARVGGHVAALKSAAIEQEIRSSGRALETLGAAPRCLRAIPYTRSDATPCIVCLAEKTGPTPARYPRRAGTPARRPL